MKTKMHDWPVVKLVNIAASKRWALTGGPFGSKLVSKDYVESGVPVIRGCNLPDDARFSFDAFVFVSENKADDLLSNNAHPGDIVFTQRGTLGQVGIVPKDGPYRRYVISQSQMKLTVDETKADREFIYYYFRSPRAVQEIKNHSLIAGVPHINLEILRNLEIPLPSLEVQRNIVVLLSAYDDLIENNTRRIKILEEMAKALYHEWFVHFRFPGHENTPMVNSELGKVPRHWEVLSLESVCGTITDGSHFSPKSVDDGLPMASVKDMHDFGINIESCRRISQEDFEALVSADCKPLLGDVLIAKDGSYLKHTFVVEKELDLVVLSSVAILRPKPDSVHPYLLALCLRDQSVSERMKGLVSGVAVPRIVLKDFRKFKIPVPPTHIQNTWAKFVEPMIKLCCRLIDKNANLRQTRDLLLPKLISGEVDVSKLDVAA